MSREAELEEALKAAHADAKAMAELILRLRSSPPEDDE